jgi:putative DNA primase/helicase
LLIAGNHKPGLKSVDEAIRRRLHLVPFSITIPPEERDPDLSVKLQVEYPGILKWMIDGCLAWQEEGLQPPPIVVEATKEYLAAEDAMAAWIDDACEIDKRAWEKTGDLYASWREWADKSGEQAGTVRRFSQNLEDRGYSPQRKMTARGFNGLKIKHLTRPHWSEAGEA